MGKYINLVWAGSKIYSQPTKVHMNSVYHLQVLPYKEKINHIVHTWECLPPETKVIGHHFQGFLKVHLIIHQK